MNDHRQLELNLAKWLLHIREEKGISQEALSVQLGKGQSDIAKMENGSKRISVLELIAWTAALNVPVERIQEILVVLYSSYSNKSINGY